MNGRGGVDDGTEDAEPRETSREPASGIVEQPPRDRRRSADGPSATAILNRTVGRVVLKRVVVLFAIVGAGVGGIGLFAAKLLETNVLGGFGAAQTALRTLVYLGAPMLAAVVGVLGAFDVGRTRREGAVLGFASVAAGTVGLIAVAGLVTALGTDGLDYGEILLASIVFAVPSGLVGAGTAWLDPPRIR